MMRRSICPGLAALAIGLSLVGLVGCTPNYDIVIHAYNPLKTYDGTTYLQLHVAGTYLSVDMNGNVYWEDQEVGPWFGGVNMGFDPLEDGNVLIMGTDVRKIVDPSTGQVLWQDDPNAGHHSVERLPWGDVLYLSNERFTTSTGKTWLGDVITIVDDGTKDILWQWKLHEHVDAAEHNEFARWSVDWSHCNTAHYYPNYYYSGRYRQVVLLLSRSLDTFWVVEYPSGDILWSCGQHGEFGRREPPSEPFLSAAHELEMIGLNEFIVFDNGNYRKPQISRAMTFTVDPAAGTMAETWSWTDPDNLMHDLSGGDADLLPNGNVLVTHVTEGRIVEVTPDKEIVWDMQAVIPGTSQVHPVYQCERVP